MTDWSGRSLHFVGIGGAGMSGLALVAAPAGTVNMWPLSGKAGWSPCRALCRLEMRHFCSSEKLVSER